MAKILIYSDLHLCENSSIVNQVGEKYSVRLEHCVASLNWVNQLAKSLAVDYIVNCGDTFDKPNLTDMEITAIKDIVPSDVKTFVLVGNHDSGDSSLKYSSAKILSSDFCTIYSSPAKIRLPDAELCFLPYITEADRKSLTDYFGKKDGLPRIIFSHNDIASLQMGAIISKAGFRLDDIKQNCDLFINGHLHNEQWFCENGLLVGNLCGKDFSENAEKYKHGAWLLDTSSLKVEFYENPYSFNFYKLIIDSKKDFKKCLNLKKNAVLYISIKDHLINDFKAFLDSQPTLDLTAYRLIVSHDIDPSRVSQEMASDPADLRLDYLDKFKMCCMDKLEHTKYLTEELANVCK